MSLAVEQHQKTSNTPIQIEWKPFMIDPGTKKEGEEYLAYNRRRWGGDGWTYSLKRDGKKIGASFANWQWWPNTYKAHQLVTYFSQRPTSNSSNEDTTSRTNQALFEALYEEGENVSSIDTLLKVAQQKLKLPADEVPTLREYLEQDKAAAQVQREIQEGRQKYRISGVPYFVIGAEPRQPRKRPYGFSGAQKPETFLEFFQELEES